jgi:hypothetical protein
MISVRGQAAAENAVLLVTLSEDILAAGAANDVMTTIAGDPLRAIVPEPNFPVAPDQVHSGLQTFQDASKDIRILKFNHLPEWSRVFHRHEREKLQVLFSISTATASRTTARFVDMTGQRDSQR